MRHLSIIVILLIFVSSCSSHLKRKNDLFYDQVTGKVSKLTMNFFSAVDTNHGIKKGPLQYKYIFYFNEDGNITQQTGYAIKSSAFELIENSIFFYNDKGQKAYCKHSSEAKPCVTYLYDENGILNKINSFDDMNGGLLKITKIKKLNNPSLSEEDEYLANGLLASKTIYKSKGDLVTEIKKYKSNGRLIEQTEFIYDTDGRLKIAKDLFNGEKSTTYSNIDSNGNYLKCINYSNGKPYQIEERILEYY